MGTLVFDVGGTQAIQREINLPSNRTYEELEVIILIAFADIYPCGNILSIKNRETQATISDDADVSLLGPHQSLEVLLENQMKISTPLPTSDEATYVTICFLGLHMTTLHPFFPTNFTVSQFQHRLLPPDFLDQAIQLLQSRKSIQILEHFQIVVKDLTTSFLVNLYPIDQNVYQYLQGIMNTLILESPLKSLRLRMIMSMITSF
jgi:hypothetical protein